MTERAKKLEKGWTPEEEAAYHEGAKQNGEPEIEVVIISSDGKRRKPREGDEVEHKWCPRCSGATVENGKPVIIRQMRRAEAEDMFTRWVCKQCGESARIANHERLAALSKDPPPFEELPISQGPDG